MNSSLDQPQLSVVIVTLVGKKELRRCLKLLTQQDIDSYEVIVPIDDKQADTASLEIEFPAVYFLPIDGKKTYAELRAAGVMQAHGKIVAITEDHCMPRVDWAKKLLAAHGESHAAVGGAVEKQPPDSALNWAVYLLDYFRYALPFKARTTSQLTDLNVSYKRAILLEMSTVWESEFHEPKVHEALLTQGQTLLLTPQVVVDQQRSISLQDAILDRYAFGRLFGSTRTATATFGKRITLTLASPLLPFLIVGRLGASVRRKGRHSGEFWRALPYILLLATCWAWGEFIGYVTGRAGVSLTPSMHSTAQIAPSGEYGKP